MESASPPVSPRVVAAILMIQKASATWGTLLPLAVSLVNEVAGFDGKAELSRLNATGAVCMMQTDYDTSASPASSERSSGGKFLSCSIPVARLVLPSVALEELLRTSPLRHSATRRRENTCLFQRASQASPRKASSSRCWRSRRESHHRLCSSPFRSGLLCTLANRSWCARQMLAATDELQHPCLL